MQEWCQATPDTLLQEQGPPPWRLCALLATGAPPRSPFAPAHYIGRYSDAASSAVTGMRAGASFSGWADAMAVQPSGGSVRLETSGGAQRSSSVLGTVKRSNSMPLCETLARWGLRRPLAWQECRTGL